MATFRCLHILTVLSCLDVELEWRVLGSLGASARDGIEGVEKILKNTTGKWLSTMLPHDLEQVVKWRILS